MSSGATTVNLRVRGTERRIALDAFVDSALRESVAVDANRWIKGLRLASVDGVSLRDRFHHRGDSLWWFTELFLHKEARVVGWLETLRAFERCIDLHAPDEVRVEAGSPDAALIIDTVAQQRRIGTAGQLRKPLALIEARLRQQARASFFTWSARLSRVRQPRAQGSDSARVAAFVHSAFWRHGAGAPQVGGRESGEEGYIGSVLEAVASRIGRADMAMVGVGPRVNFRARTWWHGVTAGEFDATRPLTPIERFADAGAIGPSIELWRRRASDEHALLASPDVREAARLDGYDLWPLVSHELRGVVRLQWPWSARAMDEAAAALDALGPSCVVTYAEAGGWGRAILLEARRRRIASVGIQHGFIYRHWLNYLHEPDEMLASPTIATDLGFPKPTRTLLHDRYAEEHLRVAGHFEATDLEVTGNPRLGALVEGLHKSEADRHAVLASVGASTADTVVVVASKYSQIKKTFRTVCEAAATSGLRLVVKCHPAETPEPYVRDAAGLACVSVAPASADLGGLLSVARGLVTVNSTVALDALVLGVPSLVVDLPNNLSPFVEQGVMLGAATLSEVGPALTSLVGSGAVRERVLERREAFLRHYEMRADPGAAHRAADAIALLATTDTRTVPKR